MTKQGARLAIEPRSLLFSDAAGRAVAHGWALPLAGDRAFAVARVWLRRADKVEQVWLPASALGEWAAKQASGLAPQVAARLQRLAAPIPRPRGLAVDRPLLMGVVNVTPDSFSDGGLFHGRDEAIAHGRALAAAGADLVDVGGESTRPGAEPIPISVEIARVAQVIEALAKDGIAVSVDTRNATTMHAAVAAGAMMINDVSALTHDPDAMAVALEAGVSVVLMHARGDPRTMQLAPAYDCAPLDVLDYLAARVDACVAAGIDRARIVVDPGIGFGKTLAHNLDILDALGLYLGLGLPVLLGASRKSFIGRIRGEPPAPVDQRLPGSLAAALQGVATGATILRVHDVAETRQAVTLWRAMNGARPN